MDDLKQHEAGDKNDKWHPKVNISENARETTVLLVCVH
jgi:hypothetical protein